MATKERSDAHGKETCQRRGQHPQTRRRALGGSLHSRLPLPQRAGAYQGSPSSLWEGVSKFHYPPRCPRARFASTGSKAALIARPACPSPPELAVVAAHLTSLSRGFRIGNTVYSVFKARKKTPLTYQEVSGANVLPLTEIFSKYFS